MLSSLITLNLSLSPILQHPASPSALSSLVPFSPSSFTLTHCCEEKRQVLQLLASASKVDPPASHPATDAITPPQPINLLAPLWLLPPSVPPETFGLTASPGSLILAAPPWLAVTLPTPWTYEPSALSTHSSSAGSTFSPAPPRFSVTPALPQSSGTLLSSYARHHGSAQVFSAFGVAQSHLVLVCSLGSTTIGSIAVRVTPWCCQPRFHHGSSVHPLWAVILPAIWVLPPSTPPWVLLSTILPGSSPSSTPLIPAHHFTA